MIRHYIEKYIKNETIFWPEKQRRWESKSSIKTQEDFEKYLAESFKVNDYLVNRNLTGPPLSCHQIHVVLAIESDFDKVCIEYSGNLAPYLITNASKENPWIRWANPDDFRLATEEEKEIFADDILQNRIKRLQKEYNSK